jgi:hypothetical protein
MTCYLPLGRLKTCISIDGYTLEAGKSKERKGKMARYRRRDD